MDMIYEVETLTICPFHPLKLELGLGPEEGGFQPPILVNDRGISPPSNEKGL
jgi:hypothetical protein